MIGSAKRTPAGDARLKRLAEKIRALAAKDEIALRRTREMARLRLAGAREIHAICAGFVNAVNGLLGSGELVLDPAEFSPSAYEDGSATLIQINLRGRILQVEFAPTAELISTEEFRVPYIAAGTLRSFNQELLERNLVEEQLLFFTLEREGGMWRYFDSRTYHSGPFDRGCLVSALEKLI